MKFVISFIFIALMFCNCTRAPEGQKTETTAAVAVPEPAVVAETYTVNTTTSLVEWEGTEPGDEGHRGTLRIANGALQVNDSILTGGTFVLDMNSITVTDLSGNGKKKLETHLKTGDFFETEKFPTGKFEITKVEVLTGNADATHNISGNLMLRDSTKNVTFPAKVSIADGKLTATTPAFTIDRTQWGVVYRSGIIGTLKDKLINDQIGLVIKLDASK